MVTTVILSRKLPVITTWKTLNVNTVYQNQLPEVVTKELKPVFNQSVKTSIRERCKYVANQDSNESFNNTGRFALKSSLISFDGSSPV